MKPLLLLALASMLIITGCIDTESTTTINKDGSGSLRSTIDMGKMITMMMAGKDASGEKNEAKDTTIYLRSTVDTSTALSARQKELLRDMSIQVNMDVKATLFKLSIIAPFKKIDDLQELNELMAKKEFDDLFDKATKQSGLGKGEEEEPGKNDNMFGSLFPDFYDCNYTQGKINCSLNKEKYDLRMADMKNHDMDMEDEIMEKMFGEATFTNRIVLPSKARSVNATTLKKVSETEYVQKGSLLELFRTPEKFVYTIEY